MAAEALTIRLDGILANTLRAIAKRQRRSATAEIQIILIEALRGRGFTIPDALDDAEAALLTPQAVPATLAVSGPVTGWMEKQSIPRKVRRPAGGAV